MVQSYRLVASINRTRGVKGEVEVLSTDGLPLRLRPAAALWVVPPAGQGVRCTHIVSERGDKARPWLFLAGVESRDAATLLLGRYLLVAEQDVLDAPGADAMAALTMSPGTAPPTTRTSPSHPPLPPDGTGLEVFDAVHGLIGTIVEESRATPQTLWTVEGPYGQVLIPAVEAFVRGWDEATVQVELPHGLLELNR